MKEVVKVILVFDDGTQKETKPNDTPIQALQKWRENNFDEFDVLEELKGHIAKFDGWWSAAFNYFTQTKGFTHQEANKMLDEYITNQLFPF